MRRTIVIPDYVVPDLGKADGRFDPRLDREYLDEGAKRLEALTRAISSGNGDKPQARGNAAFRKRERLEAEATKMRAKNLARCAVEPNPPEYIGTYRLRGMPWNRQCFVCHHHAWCRHREPELVKLYQPTTKG